MCGTSLADLTQQLSSSHGASWCCGPAELMARAEDPMQSPMGTSPDLLGPVLRPAQLRAWSHSTVRYQTPISPCPFQIADCTLVKGVFHKGLSILFVIIQSPFPLVHGCVTALVANASAAYSREKSWQG